MRSSLSAVAVGTHAPPPVSVGEAWLRLEQERPEEIKKVEELKKKKKALERELSEQRKKQQEQQEQASAATRG